MPIFISIIRLLLRLLKLELDCLRINPGNIGSEDKVNRVINSAIEHNTYHQNRRQCRLIGKETPKKYGEPCPEALVESAMNHVEILQKKNFDKF